MADVKISISAFGSSDKSLLKIPERQPTEKNKELLPMRTVTEEDDDGASKISNSKLPSVEHKSEESQTSLDK